jgi:exonuclease VII large subunit
MRINESTIRRIIREEARWVLSEAVEVAVADENGNITRLPEKEALKHFQAQVADTNRKADEAERELKALQARNAEELRSTGAGYRQELQQMHDAEIARQQKETGLSDIFARVSTRILRQIQRSQMAGDEKSVLAMFKLGNTLTAAYSASDETKMKQLDQSTAEWAETHAGSRSAKK